ncbi:glycosyltransferase 87 family protein [Nocardioides currus]|uniref:DUF2029 domain-containing protein n=1 Tax=Nocardioides currus TaxID=2133958 RepID=A0A2R7YXW5_9ACTN|nr:glycosyltransferase 87 family protein [Nocardioides currus]PUA81203.1 hypothetical protein C7S10_09190 [Nocardioides currus]
MNHPGPSSPGSSRVVAPSRDDLVVASVSEVVGGPLGDHAGRHPWWTPLRVVLLLAALAMSLGIVAKAPCLDTAGDTTATSRYTDLCWSDTSTAYVANGFAEGYWPFSDDGQLRARYAPAWVTPLPAYVGFAAQRITGLLTDTPDLDARALVPVNEVIQQPGVRHETRVFTLVNAVLLAGVGLLAAGLLTGVRRTRPWDAAAFALAPVLVLFFPIAWELLAGAAVAGALWAFARRRSAVAGVAIGVGAATSPYAALLVVPAVAVLLRERRTREAGVLAASAVGAWAVLMQPALLSSRDAWLASWKGYTHGADIGSLWLLMSQAGGLDPSNRTRLTITVVLVLAACAVVVWLSGRERWGFASLSTVLVALTLVVSPASAPSYALVLLPLAVVAVRQWSHLLVWQACEIGHWVLLGFYLGGLLAPSGGGDARAYWLAVVLRIAGLVWLVAATVGAARDPLVADIGEDLGDVDPVEAGRGEPDADVDGLPDVGHARA